MRSLVLLASVMMLGSCSVQERKASPPVEDRDTAAAVARVRAIPGLGARLRPESALVPATLGVKLDAKLDLDVIVPLTARGPLRIQRDLERVLDVNADDRRDPKGLIESGAMVFVAPSDDLDSVMIAEPARFTDLRVFRGPKATSTRLHLTLGDGLAQARVSGNVVTLVTKTGAVWLQTDPLESIDANGIHRIVTPKLEGDGRTPTLVVPLEPNGQKYPVGIAIAWFEAK